MLEYGSTQARRLDEGVSRMSEPGNRTPRLVVLCWPLPTGERRNIDCAESNTFEWNEIILWYLHYFI